MGVVGLRRRVGRFASVTLIGFALAACSASGGHASLQRTAGAFGESSDAVGRIELQVAEGHPRLTMVTREGDPAAGVAVAIVTQAPPRANLVLALLLEDRLTAAGIRVGRRVDRDAFFFTAHASDTELAPFFAAVARALAAKVTPADLTRAETRLRSLGPLPSEPAELTELNRCSSKLALADNQPTSLAVVEQARVKAFTSGRVSFAVVGPASAKTQAEQALLATPTWPDGATDAETWLPARTTSVGRSLSVARGVARISVAYPVSDPRAAAAAAERMGRPLSPLRAKLGRLRVPFSIVEVGGVTKPHGGCIFVTVTSRAVDSGADLAGATGLASAVVEAELANAGNESFDPSVASRQVLHATDPVDAATIASWWALASPAVGKVNPQAVATALLDADATDASVSAVRDAISKAALPSTASLAPKVRIETGQGELWVALADPCALEEEEPHQWGTASLVALAATLATNEIDGVTIEPLIDARGVGVFAHAAPRKGEVSTELAERVAGAAAGVLFGKPVTGDGIVEAQSIARTDLERRWGRETLGLVPLAAGLSPEHPSMLEPLGSFAQISRGDAERSARRWRSLGSSGLSLAVLGNVEERQGTLVGKTVGRWLTGPSEASCKHLAPGPRSGRTEVHGTGGGHSAWLMIGIPTDRSGSGRVARELLDGESAASLSRPALASVPGARARAWVTASGQLVVTVQAPDELIDASEKIMTELLGRLGRGEIVEPSLKAAAEAADDEERDRLSDPRERLRRLLFGGELALKSQKGPDLSQRFKAFAQKTLSDRRWIVVLAHPE